MEPMDKRYLEECLAKGMSLKQIAAEVGRAPGTVGYWVKRHGLEANGAKRFSPGRALMRDQLVPLLEAGLSMNQMAARLGVGNKTVAYWIARHELPKPHKLRRADRERRLEAGDRQEPRSCVHHGRTTFELDRRGWWKCLLCRQEAVSRRRREVKRQLVAEAGGACRICGYSAYEGALHFHHLDPKTKRFGLSMRGMTAGIDAMRLEAAKCVLLCANCHAEVEAGISQLTQ